MSRLILILLVFSTTASAKSLAAAGASKAITQEVIDAVAQEMNRASVGLRLPGAPKPYFISYKITEVDVSDVSASLGAVTAKQDRHFVSIEAKVRVGDYSFDNSNYVVPDAAGMDGEAQITLPIDATPKSARRAAWLITDAAYKEALIQLRAKKEAGVSGVSVPSLSQSKSVVGKFNQNVQPKEKISELAKLAESVSGEFSKYPHIRDSRVSYTSFIERRWYLNTEGTSARDVRRVSGVVVTATSLAKDGQELADFVTHYDQSILGLPKAAALKKEAAQIASNLQKLSKAPRSDAYSGPILFEGQAAGAMVRHGLARHLGGTPLPVGMAPQSAKLFGGAFHSKVGMRVMPTHVTVIDNPTEGNASIGGYALDDEGVAAQKVVAIKDGKLKSLLSSRTPLKAKGSSNGHARRVGQGGVYHGSATNLTLSSKKGLTSAKLRKKFLALIRKEGLEFGIVVKKIDDAAVTSVAEYSRRELLRLIKISDLSSLPPVLLAYRVYPNGKEELVRGLGIKPFDAKNWRNLAGVGRKAFTYSYLASGEPYIAHKVRGTSEGFVPSGGIESTVKSPDLLFPEIDLDSRGFAVMPAKIAKP